MEERAVKTTSIDKLANRPQVRGRMDEESLAGLAQTIKETGVLQPLLVRREGSEFVVVEGHRRLAASKMAGLSEVPVLIDRKELPEAEVVYRQLVVNCSREDLNPLDKSRAIQRLIDLMKWSASATAVKLGMSPGMVTKLLSLLKLPASVQEKVASGALPLTTAYALSQAPDAESQQQLASEAANGGLRREVVARRVKARNGGHREAQPTQAPARRNFRVVLPIDERCQVRAPGQGVTVRAFADSLSAFLRRVAALEPKDMELSDAAKVLEQEQIGSQTA